MINTINIVCITTTTNTSSISSRRRDNLVNNFSRHNIHLVFNYGITDSNRQANLVNNIKNMLELYRKLDYEYAIICDDDFFCISDFLTELSKTVELLPSNWRCLHLCPGYLWGRRYRDMSKISGLNPEHDMTNISYHEQSGRFYTNCDARLYTERNFWLGGPIAMLVNKNNFESLLSDFLAEWHSCPNNNDVVLTRILSCDDYICREPMLGYEEECGGTIHMPK